MSLRNDYPTVPIMTAALCRSPSPLHFPKREILALLLLDILVLSDTNLILNKLGGTKINHLNSHKPTVQWDGKQYSLAALQPQQA